MYENPKHIRDREVKVRLDDAAFDLLNAMSTDEPEIDPEVITWAASCYRRARDGRLSQDLNAEHLLAQVSA